MREYVETFFRRKWLFFIPFVLVLAMAIVGGVYLSWQYQVEARLWIEQNPLLDQAAQDLSIPRADAADEYSRLSALLQTDDFLGRVVDTVPALKAEAVTDADRKAAIIALRRNLVAWITEQKLITFRYRDRDPVVAQGVVSNTIDLFLAQRFEDRVSAADDTIAFLQGEQANYQQQLEQASTELAAWENAHPVATRASLEQSEQLEFQRLKNNYDSVYDHLRYVSAELERAEFSREKAISQHSNTYVMKDRPIAPENPELPFGRVASIALAGLAVAAGLGFTFVALATWFGGRRVADGRTAIPDWLDRMMAREEQLA